MTDPANPGPTPPPGPAPPTVPSVPTIPAPAPSGGGAAGKILIGCMVVGGLVTVLGGAGLYFGGKWLAGQARDTLEELSPVDLDLKVKRDEPSGIAVKLKQIITGQKAKKGKKGGGSATSESPEDEYQPPKDGVMDEERLKVFLDVRRDVLAMYKSFEGKADDLKKSKSADFLKGMRGVKMLADMKKRHRQALEDRDMAEGEYGWYAGTVYGALIGKAAGLMEKDGGKAIAEGLAAMTELMDTGDLSKSQKKELAKSRKKLEKLGKKAQEYPKENLALVDKYKVDIKELQVPALDSMFFTGPKAWKHAFPFKALTED